MKKKSNILFPQNRNHTKIVLKHILIYSVLIAHKAFLGIIGNETSGKYKFPTHNKISMDTFRKCKNEVIGGFNDNIWFGVDISKVGHGSSRRYVDSCCLARVTETKSEVIGILHQKI